MTAWLAAGVIALAATVLAGWLASLERAGRQWEREAAELPPAAPPRPWHERTERPEPAPAIESAPRVCGRRVTQRTEITRAYLAADAPVARVLILHGWATGYGQPWPA